MSITAFEFGIGKQHRFPVFALRRRTEPNGDVRKPCDSPYYFLHPLQASARESALRREPNGQDKIEGGGGSSLCPNGLRVRPSASGMIGRLSGEEAGMVRTEWNVY